MVVLVPLLLTFSLRITAGIGFEFFGSTTTLLLLCFGHKELPLRGCSFCQSSAVESWKL